MPPTSPSKSKSRQQPLGRFGTAAEFNHLGWGELVNPQTQLGLRPTFHVRAGIGRGGGFWASPYPGFATYMQNGFEWLVDPRFGSVIHTRLAVPANIICSVPYLVSSPVRLTPVLPSSISRKQWEAAGLDPERQALVWRLPDGGEISLITNLWGLELKYTNEGTGAVPLRSLPSAVFPFTEGMALDPGADFTRVNSTFACLPLQERFLPSGQYRFRAELTVIPRALAYPASNEIPPTAWYRNRHLPRLLKSPTTNTQFIGTMPAHLPIPTIYSLSVARGKPGETIEISGSLLDRAQAVTFAPGLPSLFTVLSDQQVRATVPELAQTGEIVVQTTRGYVASSTPFEITGPATSVIGAAGTLVA